MVLDRLEVGWFVRMVDCPWCRIHDFYSTFGSADGSGFFIAFQSYIVQRDALKVAGVDDEFFFVAFTHTDGGIFDRECERFFGITANLDGQAHTADLTVLIGDGRKRTIGAPDIVAEV